MRLKERFYWTEKEAHKWEYITLERFVTGVAVVMRLVFLDIYKWKDSEIGSNLFGNAFTWTCAIFKKASDILEPMDWASILIAHSRRRPKLTKLEV
jgi:hypothetical protein